MAKEFVRGGSPEANKLQELMQQAKRTQRLYEHTLEMVKEAEAALRQERQLVTRSEYRFRALIDALPQGIYMKAPDLTYVACNVAHARALRLASPKETIGRRDTEFHPPELARKYENDDMRVLKHGETIDKERTTILDGREVELHAVKTPVRDDHGHIKGVLCIYWDITERKLHERLLQARLRLTEMASKLDQRQLMQATLDMAEVLTGSNIGFFHFVGEDQKTISLQAWSTHTVEAMCTAEGAGMDYRLSQAGVWADAIRSRKPVIHDDYAAMPDKKGMPEGHAEVSRLVTVPLIRNSKVVAAIGIGNKPQPYVKMDIDILLQLANLAWDVIGVKKAEQALKLSEETYRSLFDHMLNGLAYCRMAFEDGKPVDFIYLRVNDNFEKLTGLKDVAGRWVSEVIPGIRENDPELLDIYGRVAMGGEPERFETYLNSLDMWFSVSVYSSKPEHFVAVFDVITERKKAEIALEHANRALMTLGTVNRELVHATKESRLMQAVCTAIVEQHGYRMAWVGYVRDNEQKNIEILASAGVETAMLSKMRTRLDENDENDMGPTSRVVRSGTTQLSKDIAQDRRGYWKNELIKAGCASDVALPLKDERGRVFGVLRVYADVVDAFTNNEIRLLEEMAGDLAFGVNMLRVRLERDEALRINEQQIAQIRLNLEETIMAITKAVEARDPYTAGHQRRVAKLATAIARRMGLDEDSLQGIHMGAMIHDIGKIKIPAEILSKPSRLNEMEQLMVRMHSKIGYDILKDVHFPWPVAEIAYQHHERIDGSGYPQGLKGDQIFLEARIVAVADVVEAMTSHRPYRPGLGQEAAIAEIKNHRGKFYDADAVDACRAVLDEGFDYA